MYCIWHIYFGYFRHSMLHLFVHILLMLQKFPIFSGHLPEHQGCFFFGYSRHSWDMYYIWHIFFGYFGHSTTHLFVHILLMLWKFHIFPGHLPEHQDWFFSDISHISGTFITSVHVGNFILDISDIQPPIYLCTSSWCSGSSAYSQDISLGTMAGFFWHSANPWDMYCICTCGGNTLISTFSPQFIFTHTTDASQVPHSPRIFTQTPKLFCFGYSAHSRDMYYIWHMCFRYFRHLAPNLFAHSADALEVLDFPGHLGFISDI